MKSIFHEIGKYLVFCAEEIPSILTIIVIPSFLGFLTLIPQISTMVSLTSSVLLLVYLWAKSIRLHQNKHGRIGYVWLFCLLITFIFSIFLVVPITALTMTNVKMDLKY
jgi:hypothetical protein